MTDLLKALRFEAEDFKIEWESPDGVRFEATSKGAGLIAEAIASEANRLLAAKIEALKPVRVYALSEHRLWSGIQSKIDTHFAWLLGARKL